MLIEIVVFWVMAPCNPVDDYQRFCTSGPEGEGRRFPQDTGNHTPDYTMS
jgi:hypothetical protein